MPSIVVRARQEIERRQNGEEAMRERSDRAPFEAMNRYMPLALIASTAVMLATQLSSNERVQRNGLLTSVATLAVSIGVDCAISQSEQREQRLVAQHRNRLSGRSSASVETDSMAVSVEDSERRTMEP